MELLTENVKTLYFKYFLAAFGSACISCVYGIVDMAAVGQYHGPDGTAAMSIVMPIFNIIYSLGLFVGIGGSVLYSLEKGKSFRESRRRNEYFSTAFLGAVLFSLLVWIVLFVFDEELLYLFGADEELLPLAMQYMIPIRYAAPIFLFTQLMGAFLRNDNAPGLATAAVIISGIFNVFGDIFFVFVLDMGIMGAGVATSMGAAVSLLIMFSHFFSKSNTLRLVRITDWLHKGYGILANGFSTFFTDFSLGIVTMLFNRQIMRYLGSSALSVFGILMNLNTFVQCCGYSVGQAAQPIISANYGAGAKERIRQTLRYAVMTAVWMGGIWILVIFGAPNKILRIFMSPTKEVLAIAPGIMRTYGVAFAFLPFNIFSTYYFQSILKPKAALVVSLGRGLLLSGGLILVLPSLFGADSLWLAMPLTEAIIALYAMLQMKRYTKSL